MTLPDCPNCGTPAGSGEFCSKCGQLNRNARLNARELLTQVFDQVIELRSPWLHTFVDLCRRPGGVALDYVEGRRARYVNPVKYCFIVVAIVVAFGLYLGNPGAFAGSKPAAIADLPANVQALIAIPFEVLLLRLMFYRHERNATEIAVLCLFLTTQATLFMQLVIDAFGRAAMAGLGDRTVIILVFAAFGAVLAYLAWGIVQFFRVRAVYAVLAAVVVAMGTLMMTVALSSYLQFGH